MLNTDNDRPGIEEQYQTAGNTSNLTVEAERRGAGDVLIAAGWSPSRIGSALLRLHSEYDGGEKSQRRGAGKTDAILLAGRLKSLPGIMVQVTSKAREWGQDAPESGARAAILWWLDRTCRRCHGRRYELIPGAPSLSSRACTSCRGSGEASVPNGQDGRRIANFLDDCVQRARQDIKRRLRPNAE